MALYSMNNIFFEKKMQVVICFFFKFAKFVLSDAGFKMLQIYECLCQTN